MHSFNGAAAKSSGKFGLHLVMMQRSSLCFNGAAAKSSGKCVASLQVSQERLGFNGAAAKSSGKSAGRAAPSSTGPASMGPPLKAAENEGVSYAAMHIAQTLQWGRR